MTAPTSSFLTDLVTGFGQLLADQIDGLVFDAAGANVIAMAVPPQQPNRVVVLTPYGNNDDPTLSMSRGGLQVRTRSAANDPRDVLALDDAVADVLLGLYPTTLPNGLRIVTLQRTSAVSLGQDDSSRWGWSSNYTYTAYRPSPHRY